MTIIADFNPAAGQHCETTTTCNLLRHAGLEISEPMLFGLGQGIGFAIFAIKSMPAPFIAGRSKMEEVTKHAAANLGFEVAFRQTRSSKKAWENIAAFIDAGTPVGAKLDCYYLDYFASDVHFAAHYVAVYGYDAQQVFVVDTAQQGGALTTSRSGFEQGRFWKGPMASNALTWTVKGPSAKPDWAGAARRAIRANAASYLAPPIRNFGASGIRKAAGMAANWGQTIEDAPAQLAQMGMLMERAGTGGGLFRRIYGAFLDEAAGYLGAAALAPARALIGKSAQGWTRAAALLETVQSDPAALDEVAPLFLQIADWEEQAFALLAEI
ncbi:BtrH N-terminal domain-containing protein [Litorivita sp. NS0012-18]|uniref:BtrH N-terminal domain-containing protein n=1 Tax=Litorivita sp. NS0012-18 TaxID=3127655 RepID=UPI00310BEA62